MPPHWDNIRREALARDLGKLMPGQCVDGEPADPRQHFYRCGGCGSMVDKRDLAEVFTHEECSWPKP